MIIRKWGVRNLKKVVFQDIRKKKFKGVQKYSLSYIHERIKQLAIY